MKGWLTNILYVFCALTILSLADASAGDFFVTSVIQDIPMKNQTHYKDFYINAGEKNGLKAGLYLDVHRRMSVYDNINSKVVGETKIKVGRLQVIHVDDLISIARLIEMDSKETTPLGGYDSVMIGDLIAVSGKQ